MTPPLIHLDACPHLDVCGGRSLSKDPSQKSLKYTTHSSSLQPQTKYKYIKIVLLLQSYFWDIGQYIHSHVIYFKAQYAQCSPACKVMEYFHTWSCLNGNTDQYSEIRTDHYPGEETDTFRRPVCLTVCLTACLSV